MICTITGWQTKQLSYGGKKFFIKNVLQGFPINLHSALNPPSMVLKSIQILTANSFWGWKSEKRIQLDIMEELKLPYWGNRGGMRNMRDVCLSFQWIL